MAMMNVQQEINACDAMDSPNPPAIEFNLTPVKNIFSMNILYKV